MKKVLTLALALVLALSLAVPALAFWGTAPTEANAGGTSVDIYLVDHDGGGSLLAGLISLPATDRGYAKNEIVAAVASLIVPANVNLVGTYNYSQLRLGGSNVSVNVTDNLVSGAVSLIHTFPANAVVSQNFNSDSSTIIMDITGLASSSSARTLRALYFAKVTGDNATMKVTLSKNWGFPTPAASAIGESLPLGEDYIVTKINNQTYVISEFSNNTIGNALFRIRTTLAGKADSIEATAQSAVYNATTLTPSDWFGVTYNGGYAYALTQAAGSVNLGRVPSSAELLVLNARMNDIFSTALGLDITKRAYSMTDGDWGDYANSMSNITESVDVEPWTPYVTVPSNVVTDPPKTGDAASILGFVMIALAGAAVVAVKKVRA